VTTDIDKKRNALTKAYPGYSWHEKVAGMSSEQVIAVFLRFERDGWPKIEPKLNLDLEINPEEWTKQDEDEDQTRLF
jgi:hypothetical protein